MIIQSIFSSTFYYSGLSWLSRKLFSKRGKYVLMFHGVSKKKSSKIPKDIQPYLDNSEFESIISWLKNSFKFLEPDDFLYSNNSGLLLTFDDGFYNNFSNVIPILDKHKVPALFFIPISQIKEPQKWLHFIESKLDSYGIKKSSLTQEIKKDYYNGIPKENLIEMVNNPLVTIGSHSIKHPLLSQCSSEEVFREILESKEYLEKITKKPVKYFAYPSGDYNQDTIDQVRNVGYHAAFGIDKVHNIGNLRYEIPRIGIYSNSRPYLSAKLSGLYLKPIGKINPIIE